MKKIAEILDRHSEFVIWVYEYLVKDKAKTGNLGLSAEQVLRSAIIKNIIDSNSSRAFLMMDIDEKYSSSSLQDAISKISERTWKKISTELVLDAKEQKIEDCKQVRVDSTVTDSNILYPTDSSLLYDCIRLINRNFQRLGKISGKKSWRFSTDKDVKIAKSLKYKINNAKTKRKDYHLTLNY